MVQIQVSLEPQEVSLALEAEPTIQELKVEEQEAALSIEQETSSEEDEELSPKQFRSSWVEESETC